MTIPSLASLVRRCASLLWRRRSARRRVQESDFEVSSHPSAPRNSHEEWTPSQSAFGKGDPAGTGDLAQAVCVYLGIKEGHSSSKTRGMRLQFDSRLRRLQRPITFHQRFQTRHGSRAVRLFSAVGDVQKRRIVTSRLRLQLITYRSFYALLCRIRSCRIGPAIDA
jgi:hypothetical protein